MKKTLLVTSLLAASVFASAANAGDINITGAIAQAACVTTATAADIKMPLITHAKLGTGVGDFATDAVTDLTIKLTGCPAIKQTATVIFNGAADKNTPTALALTGVTGVALALFEENGTDLISINGAAKPQNMTGTPTKDLKYKLKYVTTKDVFKEGNATAVLNFDVNYN